MQETRPRETVQEQLDAPVLGDVNAPVVVRYFGDFKCAHCRGFELSGTLDDIHARYVARGAARIEFMDFPVMGPDAVLAARASRFVWRTAPDVYWPWHRRMMEKQSDWSGLDELVALCAEFPDVDAEGLREALAGEGHVDEVERLVRTARGMEVPGTPAVAVGAKVALAIDPAAVDGLIREALGGGA